MTPDETTTTVPAKTPGKEHVQRFNVRQRMEHILLMASFTALSLTGLIQLFYRNEFATWTVLALGGIETTRLIHRALGVIFTLGIVYHFVFLAYLAVVRRARPTIVPNLKDFKDVVAELRNSLGMKAPRPQFHRYDYRQKFEYIGLLFGSLVLIATGLILMFPELVASVLPGQFLAAAAKFHGYEATLAVLTILIWHLYSVIFRPGMFPADTSIFTGRISKARMIEEHPLEYQEIIAREGQTEAAE